MKSEMQKQTEKFVKMLRPAVGLKGKELDSFLSGIERKYIEKKKKWVREHEKELIYKKNEQMMNFIARVFYIEHLGVPKDKMDVIENKENKLVSRFYNECPILNACQILGLDTKVICKKAFHEPYQAFLSEIDPKIHFSRDYKNIRPYADYCEETISFE